MRIIKHLATAAVAVAVLGGLASAPAVAAPAGRADGHGLPSPAWDAKHPGKSAARSSSTLTSTVTYVYAGGHQVLGTGVTAQGAAANVMVAEPYEDTTNDGHTLMEIAARDTASGNTIEIGWTVDQALNGDVQAHLFSGAWKNGVFLGYNATAPTYVDYGGNPINVGANLHSVVTNATFTSRIKKFLIQHDTTVACGSDPSGGWWVSYDNAYVGCYPNSTWGTNVFTSINNAEYFSEVPTFRTSGKPCSDAGNGLPGSSAVLPLDASDPAFFASTSWVNPSPAGTTSVNTLFNQDQFGTNTAAAYDAFNIGSTGNRTFTLGGKGFTSTGTTPGNYASC